MATPEIIVNGGSAGVKASVSASTAWTATLDSTDGVRQVAWSVSTTDETTTAASYTLVQSGSVGQNVASTSQGQGTALILQAIVNAGVNAATGQADPTGTTAKVKIYVPLADGGEVGCAGEEYESDATFGATGIINSGIRKAAALSPSGVAVKIVRAATAAALPANTRTSNVLTADINGAIGTVGGVAVTDGDYILVQNEGGGASHVNNGAFVLADGDGSNPWTLTRATYFDDSAELIAMTTFRIQEGTYAGKERYLVTSGATINVTALEFAAYSYAPNDAAYLTVGAVSDLSAERNVSAITSTLDFASTTTIPLQASRTDAATAALVDAATLSTLSSGAAAAGFGPALKFLGEVSGGGAENYGRIGFAATDLTGGSEDTKAVLQARTAGAALATVAEFSGTAVSLPGIATGVAGILAIDTVGSITRTASSAGADATAKYVTDNATVVNANDVPLQAMTGTLEFKSTARPVGFAHETAAAGTTELVRHRRTITAAGLGLTGTGGYDSWWIPDGAGTEVEAFRLNARWNQVVGPYAEVVLSLNSNGSLTERITFGASGSITTPGIITGASFIGVSLDRATAGALTLGGTNATSVACSGLALTGVLSIDNSTGTIAVGANTTSQSFGKAGTTASFLGANTLTEATTLSALTTGVVHAGVAGLLSSSTIVNADVSASAAIAGTKIDPAFGAQNISQTGATSITAGSAGFIGVSLDTSGAATLTLGGTNATALTVSRTGIVTTVAGGLTVNGAGAADILTVQKDGIGTTKTIGGWVKNATNSGTQVTPQFPIYSAVNGGVTVNAGWQWEPQSTSRGKLVLYYGTGSTAPASTGFLLDTSDPTYGVTLSCSAFQSTGGTGFRMSVGGGGVKENGGTGQTNLYGASTSIGTLLESALAVGDSDPNWDLYASAGTRTAGNFITVRDGGGTVFEVSSATATRGHVKINGVDIGWNVRVVAVGDSPVTAAVGDRFLVDTSGGIVTINLPAVPSLKSARQLDIMVIDAKNNFAVNRCTLTPNGAEKINNAAASVNLTASGTGATLVHDGDSTNWWIV